MELSDSDSEGISETWVNDNVNDVEEGEIVPDYTVNNNHGDDGIDGAPAPVTEGSTGNMGNPNAVINSGCEKSPDLNDVIINLWISLLAPLSLLGLFLALQLTSQSAHRLQLQVKVAYFKALSKKRKLDNYENFKPSCPIAPRKLMSEFIDPPPSSLQNFSVPTSVPVDDLAPTFDLNISAHNSNLSESDTCSSTNEIESLIKIGNGLGFQISEENIEILEGHTSKDINGAGDTVVCQ
ncbi:hypothetical protein L2E82_41534 [Cichorium intybus]|uniref:Uncharacterized protein n=1 Tax=Cichorium intybus TaxID=13427 RepID=A0ACB9ANC5_CICIN|nr:hypothetical protein L2E82_41534 [Cichorium intybus]